MGFTLDENGQSEPQWPLRAAAVPAAYAVITEGVRAAALKPGFHPSDALLRFAAD